MKKTEMTYFEAIAEVEKILGRINSGEVDIDTLGEDVKRATELIKLCKQKLCKVESDVEKALDENQ